MPSTLGGEFAWLLLRYTYCCSLLSISEVFDSAAATKLSVSDAMFVQQSRMPATILVIEDYADSRAMFRLLLQSLDYRVVTAKDGKEALAVAADEHIDLVLTDLGLPDMSGVTLVRHLRRLNEQLRRVPIIMLTAYDGPEYQRSAIQAGCTDFLTKPLDFDKLQSMIERLLKRHDHERSKPGHNSTVRTWVFR
jgi:CheY-like chemotaxis protein